MPPVSLAPLQARTFKCCGCQTDVRVCTVCDRGQRYCSANCRNQVRRACQRRASACYQRSRVGSINHARRQQQYRERQRQEKQQLEPEQIVTQQCSQQASAGDLLVPEMELGAIDNHADVAVSPLYCHWCSRAITGVRRMGWLRHSEQAEPDHRLNGEPRGQSP